MLSTRPHFDDLKRRYREADWVSEYQRLWAIFNHWLCRHTGHNQDRECVDTLKSDSHLESWIHRVIQRTTYDRPHHTGEGYGGSYPRFAADSEISRFFREVQESLVLEPRISWPWRIGSERRVREINTITLSREQFRTAYEAHAEVLSSEKGMVHDETLHQILPALGIHTTGCCFYRSPVRVGASTSTAALTQMTLSAFRSKPALSILVNLADLTTSTSLSADIVETLYNLRNVAMHGQLDFLNENDNAAARAGYDLLDSLIKDIRDNW